MPNFSKNEHLLPSDTHTYVSVSGGKKCQFFKKFSMLCFLRTPVLRFALLPYYRRLKSFYSFKWVLKQYLSFIYFIDFIFTNEHLPILNWKVDISAVLYICKNFSLNRVSVTLTDNSTTQINRFYGFSLFYVQKSHVQLQCKFHGQYVQKLVQLIVFVLLSAFTSRIFKHAIFHSRQIAIVTQQSVM